jgi:uncharacterized protein (DUF1810 family)
MNSSFNLQRFIDAQSRDYEWALREIKNGLKQGHWIWYIFPQLKGFGHSYNSEYYGIDGIEEALAYYNHPVLGSRLIEITKALLEHSDKSAKEILSPIDARKVKSCMTLFWLASENPLFMEAIETFYEDKLDQRTIEKCEMSINMSSNLKATDYRKNPPIIEINTEIMVEINNLCHLNEVRKVETLLKYMIPKWYRDSKSEDSCIYFREIYLKHSPEPRSSVIYEGLPKEIALFCWKEEGVLHGVCYVSVVEDASFRSAIQINFEGMDDQDCDPDELGWYYFMAKKINIDNVVNYSGSEYAPVFRIDGDTITCCKPPIIRHKYRLKSLSARCDDYSLKEKYHDLYRTGNWNAKHAIERGGFNPIV